MNADRIARVARDWKEYASEPVNVEYIGCAFYGFGSELATLRLMKRYRTTDKATQGYSKNLSTFYFRLDADLDESWPDAIPYDDSEPDGWPAKISAPLFSMIE